MRNEYQVNISITKDLKDKHKLKELLDKLAVLSEEKSTDSINVEIIRLHSID